MKDETLDIQHLASLARISISEGQAGVLKKELGDILEMIGTLSNVETTNIRPLSYASEDLETIEHHQSPHREDVVRACNQREKLQSVATNIEDGLYIVPQFISTD